MNNVSLMLESLANVAEGITHGVDLLTENRDLIEDQDFAVSWSGGRLRVTIKNLDQLPAARAMLRKIFGSWSDTKAHNFYCIGIAHATWEGSEDCVDLWLESSVEDFPEELLGEKCKWKPRKKNDTEYDFVCDVAGEEE